MTIRRATAADLPTLERLWRDFQTEVPEPDYVDVDRAAELQEIEAIVRNELAVVAEDDGRPVGFALARLAGSRLGLLTDLYVAPDARHAGVASTLVREAVSWLREHGRDTLRLEVVASNVGARAIYASWGFREDELTLSASLDELERRLEPAEAAARLGVVFVQTDDIAAVERAATAFAPRIRSSGSEVAGPENGWIAVRDRVAEEDPAVLRRLARELSDRLGAVVVSLGIEAGAVVRVVALERGSVLDEYLSVPEFLGPLPPGDVVALAANPTVLARLTGAEPAAIRAVARTAGSPRDLPPARELAAAIAAALGLPAPDG